MARLARATCICNSCSRQLEGSGSHVARPDLDEGLARHARLHLAPIAVACRLRLPGRLWFETGSGERVGRDLLFCLPGAETGRRVTALDHVARGKWTSGRPSL